MKLVRFQPISHQIPWGGFSPLFSHFDHMLSNVHHGEEESNQVNWLPNVDVTEYDNRFEFIAELPGMEKDDIKLELKDNFLTISGKRNFESEEKDRNLHIRERRFGSFNRSFRLPMNTDPEKIDAEYKNGVLSINLLKKEEAKPKQIDININ